MQKKNEHKTICSYCGSWMWIFCVEQDAKAIISVEGDPDYSSEQGECFVPKAKEP